MPKTMAEPLFERRFSEMQKYIPFLDRVIDKLKINDQDNIRKAQIEKMQMLHNLLTNKQKKLKIDTLLKCETVLKKLHAKFEKPDELIPQKTISKSSDTAKAIATVISSDKSKNVQPKPQRTTFQPASIPKAKSVPNFNNLIEINTCPASPTQLGDEDFRPPVEIPTERRSSPVRTMQKTLWDESKSQNEQQTTVGGPSRYQNRSSDVFHQQSSHDRSKSKHSRWSDSKDWTQEPSSDISPSSSSAHHRSWSSSSSSSAAVTNHRTYSHQRNEPIRVFSSDEENWDDPEDEIPAPKPITKSQPPAPPITHSPSSQSQQQREHREPNNIHQHRHHDKRNYSHDISSPFPLPFPPLPDISLDKDETQKKLFHDTIYKYKKPDLPKEPFYPFMNIPQPDSQLFQTQASNIFNRLGEKVDNGFQNFRIEVKNDKMKQQPSKPTPPLPLKLTPTIPNKPIDEVLRSPPLSADDIDDLLNESLDAANGKTTKSKAVIVPTDNATSALDIVRKKLAMISKAPPSGMQSPTPSSSKDHEEIEQPFYRRGHTPTKKLVEPSQPHTSSTNVKQELFKPPAALYSNYSAEPSPRSPTNPIDPVIQRLALKYHPHRKRDSVPDKPEMQSLPDMCMDSMTDRLALKYNPHPRREPLASPVRTVDPRVGKIMGQISPLVGSPIATSPVPNVLPAINLYDPRLRNSRFGANVDSMISSSFCTQIPFKPIPGLMDLNLSNTLPLVGGDQIGKPSFCMPIQRQDPRAQKHASSVYAEKFNPERNDQTERMKYLESKKKKLPEPKTYGEYKQSKCRQQAAEEATKVDPESDTVPVVTNATPSTLDKMYRNAQYDKELGGNISGFKIPKKPKSEEPKIDKKEEPEGTASEESSKELETPVKKPEAVLNDDESNKRTDDSSKKCEQNEKVAKETDDTQAIPSVSEENQKAKPEEKANAESDNVAEEEDSNKLSITSLGRRRSRRKSVYKQSAKEDKPEDSKIKIKPDPEEIEQKVDEDEEEEIKPRRIGTRRLTILKDQSDEDAASSPSASPIRCRSASEIFSPTTDNSIVSTQNIISGKRKTRASINFNEKATKKPATPKATSVVVNAPTKTSTPKTVEKVAPKLEVKKSPPVNKRTRRLASKKQQSDDGQICAVSSTTSQSGDVYESHNDDSVATEDVESPEEPSSTGLKAKRPMATADADENQKKQEWLEGFLKSIVDPSTNKDCILDMLKAVLDEKKLEQVKNILYSTENEEMDVSLNAKKTDQEQNKPRVTRTKKNELDRLNEDIRDMFICQGVVTATGRRMCTLAKETSRQKSAKLKEQKEPPKEQSKERKTRSKDGTTSAATSQSPVAKRQMRKAKVLISPLNMRALRSRVVGRPPEMPVLEPNTPTKLPEEDADKVDKSEEVQPPLKKKPGPKSKVPPPSLFESDEDDDNIQLVHLRKKIKCDQDVIPKKEICKEIVPKKVIKEEIVNQCEMDKQLAKPSPLEVQIPKNTNSKWHSMSEYTSCCIICKEKPRHMAPHYISSHNDSEVYTSRLPPEVLEEFKQNIGNRALYSLQKKSNLTGFHYRCPFCFFQATNSLRSWMEHFTTHTGEYQFKCSGCFKAMNGCSHMMEHIKRCRPDAKKISRPPIKIKSHTVNGYVCHLCNFIQMQHSGIVRHLSQQHNLNDEESIAGIIQIKLIDSVGVQKMDESKEAKMVNDKFPTSPAPTSAAAKDQELMKAPRESNMEVFLPRQMSSPTSDVLTERLKSIDQDDDMTSDSSVNTTVAAKEGQADKSRMTIAERLSQRFKNIEKRNLLGGEREEVILIEVQRDPEVEKEPNEPEVDPLQMETDQNVSVSPSLLSTQEASENTGCPSIDSSFNESGRLVIDEHEITVDDIVSESDWADENNDEDDNENWEDIEITETKGALQKDKNKNKSIFQTLSRLYASIAPKKRPKKSKEKETRKTDLSNTEKPTENKARPTEEPPSVSVSKPAPRPGIPPPTISNLSDLLPDSPSDSLDMLLATNFNCLEGDGTSFPHLDLNDLESPIFLLSEEQTNLQDAIAMATDMEHIKYDVLGNPLSAAPQNSAPSTASSVQRVGNFGFSLNGDSLKYYCMVKACTFLFSDHPDGLQNHFLLEHPALRWNGFCHSCNAQVCPEGGREMQHMLDFHSKPKTVDQSGEKPRIKFRRLTGDILSTGKQPVVNVLSENKESNNIQTTELSLTTLLQSEPRAMNQPAPPPAFDADIPLYKNVSKEFTITGVAAGVKDDDLRKLVLNQAESTPGGMQISQVVSLNSRANSLSPASQLPELMPAFNRRNSVLQTTENLPNSRSPVPIQINLPICIAVPPLNASLANLQSQRNSPVQTMPSPKIYAYKCCAINCQFATKVQSAMNEHIAFHMRTDNDRGSMKCSECAYAGRNITDYFQHMTRAHFNPSSNAASVECNVQSTNELTEKIQNILRGSTNAKEPVEGAETNAAVLPTRQNFIERLKKVVQEMVAETGLADEKLWKCPLYPECTTAVVEPDFITHLSNHISQCFPSRTLGTVLRCPHCTASYHRPMVLKAHIKTHSRHQYFCHVCSATLSNFQQAQKHVQETHMRFAVVQSQPLIPDTTFVKSVFYLVSTKKLTPAEVMQFGEKLVAEWERKSALNKTHFQPNEQYLLPLQPIFNNQVFCSVCNYKTKVRTNMYRHLQLHKQEVDVASVDPVNPVPCLEKNEKHFDKMLNLACSSNTTGVATKSKDGTGSVVKIPSFVPDMRRFVCGHPGCTYLTISEQMLRSHLNALHSGEKGYQCPHCQEDICKKNLCAERIVQHLRFHGSKIFQCGECDYLHYTKYVVERHMHDKHSTLPLINLISYDRNEREVNKTTQPIAGKATLPGSTVLNGSETREQQTPAATSSISSPNKCKWECALCKHQTVTWNQMISHSNSAHRAKHQYHCVHCPFGSAHLSHIMDHIDTKHPTKTREAKYMFYKINETPQDKAADTRPLWSRDDPKRVRSIRGILMENEEDAERTKQSLSNAGVDLDDDDDDDDVEIVQVIESESAMKPDILGCFHCDYTSEEMSLLTSHWKAKHWHVKNDEIVPQLPFFFRIHSPLKCPLCSFKGDYISLQLHSSKYHQRKTFWASDPKFPNMCGHCPFKYHPNHLESLNRHYQREHKPTDVKNLSSSMLRRFLALGDCQVYMQCYFCAEICPDKTAIIDHERTRHGSANFRYKQIKDEVIYRCVMCQYSSTNEMATLRHMIDHFGAFKTCYFCKTDQSSFNAYMQHCYACHSKQLKHFKEIYPLFDMTFFLGQMLLIFPNGLIVSKKNLLHTQYGSTERIYAMYDEICKKALEPPIPPLCMARLMAKKSIEAREASSLLPPPPVPVTAKRIAKRRSTVALGMGDHNLSDFTSHSGPQKIKKRKSSICEDRPGPPVPLFSTITSMMYEDEGEIADIVPNSEDLSVGVSHYGKQPETVDLSTIYTQIAIGDKFAPVSVKKFALLFKMNAKVVVEKMNFKNTKRSRVISKPCPASRKPKQGNLF